MHGAASERHRQRQFAQNDLVSGPAVHRILRCLQSAGPILGCGLLEIGPGEGNLTLPLLACGPKLLIGIEIDSQRVDRLARHAAEQVASGSLVLNLGDARDRATIRSGLLQLPDPKRIVGSLPYNAGTTIVDALLDNEGWTDAHVLLQREVADRLVAHPASKSYGYLSVITQARADPTTALRLPPSAFRPRPKVESTLVRLVPRPAPLAERWSSFKRYLSIAFGRKRKILANALKPLDPLGSIRTALTSLGFDARIRAEELSWEEHATLCRWLEDNRGFAEHSPAASEEAT